MIGCEPPGSLSFTSLQCETLLIEDLKNWGDMSAGHTDRGAHQSGEGLGALRGVAHVVVVGDDLVIVGDQLREILNNL